MLFEEYAITVLGARRRTGGIWFDFRCRAHDDNSASASINAEDGRVRCQACTCDFDGWIDQYAEACGLPAPPDKPGWKNGKPIRDDEDPPTKPERPQGVRPTSVFYYDHPKTGPHMRVRRLDLPGGKKSYPQGVLVDGKWVETLPKDFERILYRLPELLKSTDPMVLVVEGEKSVECARKLGFTATTASGGANNADKTEDWSALAGKDVVIIADNDAAGKRHARQVAGLLIGIARTIRIITMPGVPEKGDIVDWVEAGGDAEQLHSLIEAAPAFGAAMETPVKPKPELSRVFVERAYVSNAWDDQGAAHVLSSFASKNFQDPVARACAQAVKRMVKRGEEVDPIAVALEMKRVDELELWLQLETFQNDRLRHLGQGRASTYKGFRELVNWDAAKALLAEANESVGTGVFQEWITARHEAFAGLLAQAETVELKTLKQHVEEWIDDILAGKKDRETFPLRVLHHHIGRSGGGDVIVCIAPPKTGKSTFAMKLVTDAAEDGYESLVCQLEMRMDQVVKREVAKLLGRPIGDDIPTREIERLRKSGKLDHLKRIRFTKRATTLAACRAEVASILAKNPQIKFWVVDYAECLQRFGEGANRVDESEAIAKFVKETAIAFNVCAFLLVQPTKEYSKEGATGPKPYHAKNSAKWEQDAQAMLFLQSPARFYADMPKEYVELHVLASRDSANPVVPMRWNPAAFDYEPWVGPVPAGGNRTLKQQTEMDRYTTPRPNYAHPATPEFEDINFDDAGDALSQVLSAGEDRYRR